MTALRVSAGTRCFAALACAFLLLAAPAGAVVHAQEPTDREIAESQRRLNQIRQERTQLREEMTRIRSRVTDLSSEVGNLERQVGAAAEAVEELEFQLAQRERQIRENTVALLHTRDRLAERRAVLHRRLRDIYKRGPLQTAQVLLAAESFSDLLNRYRYLFIVARHDRTLAEEVAGIEAELVARERALRSNVMQVDRVRRERSEERDQLAVLQAQQRQALTSIRSRESATAARIAQLERDEASLTELVADLERRRREAEAAAAGPAAAALPAGAATLGPALRGTLAWPVDGRIVYPFGRDVQPNGTVVRWNGVGIAAPAGTPVRAVAGGTVVLAGPFEGYGPTVALSHGGGYYTLYLYLRELNVREGGEVTEGQTIGTVGGERTAEGARLEFQVRVPGGQAVDPLEWLRRR